MRFRRPFLALSMGFMLTAVTACQQNSGVQAAREDRSASDSNTSAGVTANSSDNTLSAEDRDVAFKIEQANIEEMDLGRFVRDKTSNGDVKSFAKMMIDDHNDALNKLQNVLKDDNVNRSANSKPADEASNMSALQNTSGADLDREYMNMMVQDHEKDLDELRNAEGTVQNADLKNYIQDLIPIVQKHLEKAQNIQNDLNKQQSR
jgi:putative membrane protein